MGRAMLIEHESPVATNDGDSLSITLRQNDEELAAFARHYVSYQTAMVQIEKGSFDLPHRIPGFQAWQTLRKLFEEPLHGYFFKTAASTRDQRLIHFTLTVDAPSSNGQSYPAVIKYHDREHTQDNIGYVSVEKPNRFDPALIYRGGFDYMPDQHRFRFNIQFTKDNSPESDWYLGTIMGLNDSRKQLLLGRFVLRKKPLDPKWLEADQLGELFQFDEPLAEFLMGVDAQIPSETLIIYNKLGWPHLPIPKQGVSFKSVLEGEYNCYALVRQRSGGKKYQIACYPLKIYADGRLQMKYQKEENGTKHPITYHGRAFHNEEVSRLFLYFDKREEDKKNKPMHLSIYFDIQPSSKIIRAFGISNRFVHTEKVPESRMEVMIAMRDGETYDKADYKAYDLLDEAQKSLIDQKEPNLRAYITGRINRILLPNSDLKANYDDPFLPRKEPFRRLHIRAALHEIEHGQYMYDAEKNKFIRKDQEGIEKAVSDIIYLLQESCLHGLGSGPKDKEFLKAELDRPAIKTAINDFAATEQTKIVDELNKLWPWLSYKP